MPDTIRTTYARLFEVRLLHHYWLDDAKTVFDSASTEPAMERRLTSYDVRRILTVQPTAATAETVAGLRGVFRMSELGFFVAVPETATVPRDAEFVFDVAAIAPRYDDYTALSLPPRPIVHVADPVDEHLVHRYRENVPELSNVGAATTGVGPAKRLYLSTPYPGGVTKSDPVESLVYADKQVRQLLDKEGLLHALGGRDALPVYVHQGDVRPIVAPPGAVGVPLRGVELTADTPDGLVAVIRLRPRPAGDNDSDFDFTTADGGVPAERPVFEVHLRNRWTYWRYRAADGSVTTPDAGPFPLTHLGNPHTGRKPPPGSLVVEPGPGSPPPITRLVSEIRS